LHSDHSFLNFCFEKQSVRAIPEAIFSDASSTASVLKQRRGTAYKMADAILQETVGVFASK